MTGKLRVRKLCAHGANASRTIAVDGYPHCQFDILFISLSHGRIPIVLLPSSHVLTGDNSVQGVDLGGNCFSPLCPGSERCIKFVLGS